MVNSAALLFALSDAAALHGGPLDDASGYFIFREIYSYLHEMIPRFAIDLFARSMAWVSVAATTLLTTRLLAEGFLIVIGRSRRSMSEFVAEMMKAVLICSIATGSSLAAGTLYDWVGLGLGELVHGLLTGQQGDPAESVDRSIGYMHLGFSFIDQIDAGDDPVVYGDKVRDMGFVLVGLGGPALTVGALLLVFKVSLGLCLGTAPLFVLCLLFEKTKQLFWNWLNYLIGTLFALSIMQVMAAIALDVVCGVAATFWTIKLTGANVEGVNSLAIQQGLLGLVMTTLIVSAPAMAAKFFKGLLGDFMPFSAFGQGGAARMSTGHAPHAQPRTYADLGERLQAPMQTHVHRVVAPERAAAHEDKIKPVEDTRSFLERYPNATASLGPISDRGDALPASLQANVGIPKAYEASDIQFVVTERTRTQSGGYLETPRVLEPGTPEYEAAKSKLGVEKLNDITAAANALGQKLAERGRPEEIDAFNKIKQIAVEVNPALAHYASYSAKAHSGSIYVNPEIFSEYQPHRQANRMAHEFRHLMKSNQDLVTNDYAAKDSPAEDDAERFAVELFGESSK